MSRKRDDEEPEEQPEPEPEGSPVAGACVLVALAVGALAAVYVAAPDIAVGIAMFLGLLGIWRAAKSMRGTANPAPPPPPEVVEDEKPQFTIVEDREGHCTVQWQKGPP